LIYGYERTLTRTGNKSFVDNDDITTFSFPDSSVAHFLMGIEASAFGSALLCFCFAVTRLTLRCLCLLAWSMKQETVGRNPPNDAAGQYLSNGVVSFSQLQTSESERLMVMTSNSSESGHRAASVPTNCSDERRCDSSAPLNSDICLEEDTLSTSYCQAGIYRSATDDRRTSLTDREISSGGGGSGSGGDTSDGYATAARASYAQSQPEAGGMDSAVPYQSTDVSCSYQPVADLAFTLQLEPPQNLSFV